MMTAIQMNAEFEKNDPTMMTKEEFFAKIERAEKQPGKSFESVEELDQFIRNL